MHRIRISLPRGSGSLATAFLLLALGAVAARAQEGADMPPPSVGVTVLEPRNVPVLSELPGRIAATRVSEVRARVGGILLERVFEQGSLVREGDVLYRIDPRLFQVRVASAQASLERARATARNARQQVDRQQTLLDRRVGTGTDFDAAAVASAQANADVALAEAALDEARLNLEYTEVRAPITGVIGGALITEGALVTADGNQNLALIQQIDPVYADFTQSAQELLALKRAVADGAIESPAPGQASVQLVFDGGDVYPQPGKLLFSSAAVDPTTGQVTLRAEFPNAAGDLLPGLYVRVRIEQAVIKGAIVIPQRAVVRKADGGAQVFVVEDGGTARARDVELGEVVDSGWVVETGLRDGEILVVDGAQKLQPDMEVVPEPIAAPGADAPAQTPSPAAK